MNYLMQVIYALLGIGSTVLDYYIYSAFVKDYHHTVYIQVAEYSDIAEGVFCLLLLIIGLLVEMGHVATDASKKTWIIVADIIYTLAFIESAARITAMTFVSIHIHPGKIDFMGLFVVMVILYFLLKLCVIMQQYVGLVDRIQSYKPAAISAFAYIPYRMVGQTQEEPKEPQLVYAVPQ